MVSSPLKRICNASALILGLALGAFVTAEFGALKGGARHASMAAEPRPRVPVPVISPAASSTAWINPSVARLGTDDFGSRTSRALVLVDTSPGQNLRDGTARLGTDPRNPQTYAAQAVLLNGARLAEIYADSVVLTRDGQSVRLYVQGKAPNSGDKSPLLEVGGGPVPTNPGSATSSPAENSRTAAIASYIRSNAVFDGDRLRGFEVYSGAQPEVFSKLGLRAADVITQINGVGVSDDGQFMDMLEQLIAGAAFDTTVERGGRTEHLALDGSVITTEHAPSSYPAASTQ